MSAGRRARALAVAPALALIAFAGAGRHHTKTPPKGPFETVAMRAFLASRSAGEVTAAAYNIKSGRLFLYNPGLRADEASIAKVDILATALFQAQQRGGALSTQEQAEATEAIERSDNDDAQALWDADDGNSGIAAFNAAAGMTQTTLDPAGAWGLYETSALDQIRLLRHVALPNDLLDTASRAYELHLMGDVEPDQAWGVSAGVLSPATVALKNGWLPVGDGWEINSIGEVSGRHRDYLLAVLTAGDPDMAYGVETIEGVAQLAWKYFLPRHLRPAAPSGTGI